MPFFYNVNAIKLRKFYDTGVFSLGFDTESRPVWHVNSECYDDSFGPEIVTKAAILFATSLLWNMKTNEYDFLALRRGISLYGDCSHWHIQILSWSVAMAVKKAMIAYPFQLHKAFVANIPRLIFLLKQFASKVIEPTAMAKVVILADQNDYFEKGYAEKRKTPICAQGTLKVSITQWMEDRGYLDVVEYKSKHKKSPSVPLN